MFNACILIPSYNHARALPKVIEDLVYLGIPCIVVNDASTDETAAVLEKMCSRFPNLQVIERSQNGGKGAAVIDGIQQALSSGYTHVLQLDADGQHSATQAREFLEAAQKNPDAFVIGRPIFDQSAPLARVWGRELSNVLLWIESGSMKIRDVLCGYRLYPIHRCGQLIIEEVKSRRMEFDPEVALRLCWAGFPVINIPTPVLYPADGLSHFHYVRDNLRIVRFHIRILKELFLRAISGSSHRAL